MSVMTDVAIRATIEEICANRDEAVALLREAYRLIERAEQVASRHSRYAITGNAKPRFSIEQAVREVDRNYWQSSLRYSGLVSLFDDLETRRFEQDLETNPPEFTVDTVTATFLEVYQRKDELFLRSIYRCFRYLDSSYATNDKHRFRVEKKSIVSGLFQRSFSGGLTINYHRRAWVNDLHRCCCLLSKRTYTEFRLESELNEWFQKQLAEPFENDYMRVKGFKNGNAHIWITDPALLDSINRAIAEYCGPVLSQERASDR